MKLTIIEFLKDYVTRNMIKFTKSLQVLENQNEKFILNK